MRWGDGRPDFFPARQLSIESSRNIRFTLVDETAGIVYQDGERQPHTGVFRGCTGELSLEYLGEQVDIRTIEDIILEFYEYDNIAYETWQEFQGRFRNVWNRYIGTLIQNLENAQEFTVDSDVETYTENAGAATIADQTLDQTRKYSDTPNQYLNDPETFNGLTDITQDGGTSKTTQSSAREIKRSIERAHNKFKDWLELSQENYNMIGRFAARFEPLFQTTTVFQTYRR